MIFGVKSERNRTAISADQLTLFGEDVDTSVSASNDKEIITYSRQKKKHPGRNSLPEHLPVEEVVIEPTIDVEGLQKIGEEITETLKYTPASLIKLRTIRPKYVHQSGEGVVVAELPSRPIAKCIAEASLLAFILVSKYVDHLPLYRQRQRFARDFQWHLPQSTIGGWVQACCILLTPLYNRLKQKLLESTYIQVDESPIKVLDKDKRGKTHQGYQWVYHDPLQKLVLFHYRKGRGMMGPKEMLADYKGYIQCDGYSVYDKIGAQKGIDLVGCLVHARRKFFDARDNDEKRANYVLAIFKSIYKTERELKEQAAGDMRKIQQGRESHIRPMLEQLKQWVEQESIKVLPKSAIGKAMNYFQNQYHKLIQVTADPHLQLDNNLIENMIRPLALGRKNYLFAGSHRAAQHSAILYSFFASCKANNVNPRLWMQHVLESINEYNIQDLDLLLPNHERFKV
jgi:transposase